MTLTAALSQKELERVAALAYEGETLKVLLASVGGTGYDAQSTVANWQTVEKSGNGYVRYSTTIGTGAYDGTSGSYLLPDIDAAFTATGAGYSFDRVVIYIDGATYPHSVLTEAPNITLAAGQTQTYRVSLNTNDA
jgi:hypothetical protein